MSIKANKGEWGEPYVAIRVLGERKLHIADANGNKNPHEWMDIVELIRHETMERIVTYRCKEEDLLIDIDVNGKLVLSVSASEFLAMADKLAAEIKSAKGSSFNVSEDITDFLSKIELKHIKAKSIDKSDVFLSVRDPRASIMRKHIGFSIKSEFGQNPTLFNTAKASAVVYKVSGMTDELMAQINSLVDDKGHAAVSERCDTIIANGCSLEFVGFPIASRVGVPAFEENLDMIDSRLPKVIEFMLWDHFFNHESRVDLDVVTKKVAAKNPCGITRPEVKYEYMMKSFIYAVYCGMTASTLWDGNSQVNGGFIKVNADGEVVAHYALESDAFKSYLFKNCYLEFPSTDEKHGHYAKVYKEGNDYYYRLNFQIRYR